MKSVTIISVGTLKERYLKEAVEEYTKKLSKYARVSIIELKEEKIQNEEDSSEIERALALEGKKIIASIPDGAVSFALAIEGKEYDSISLSKLISEAADRTGKLCFIIGSSHGLSEEVKREADLKLSFSKMTFPHQLMRVMLLEAIYRSFTIIGGAKYHK